LSVFNLFVVSVFWAFMADVFDQDQGKRLFGFIALGGTLGALTGPAVTAALTGGIDWGVLKVEPMLNPPALLIVSSIFLEVAVQCVRQLMRIAGVRPNRDTVIQASALRSGADPGPGALEGLRLIASSPYLLLICIFMVVFTILSSLLYMEQGRIVEQTFTDNSTRTAAFARLDFYTQSLTLLLQLFITGRLVKTIGVGATLTVVPLLTILGFAALMTRDSFAVLGTFMVLRRAFHYALDRPAREVLYTVVGPDAKYKSKSFIDTFIYRFGDAIGGWTQRLLVHVGVAVGLVAIPLAITGAIVGLGLGFLQTRERWTDRATAQRETK
jgi:AAA family ATP:ADP antiporter